MINRLPGLELIASTARYYNRDYSKSDRHLKSFLGDKDRFSTIITMSKCKICQKSVYPVDPQLNLDGSLFHKSCAKCSDCKCQLSLSNFSKSENADSSVLLLCKTHYFARFNSAGGAYVGGDKFTKTSSQTYTGAKPTTFVAPVSSEKPAVVPFAPGRIAKLWQLQLAVALLLISAKLAVVPFIPWILKLTLMVPYSTRHVLNALIFKGKSLSKTLSKRKLRSYFVTL